MNAYFAKPHEQEHPQLQSLPYGTTFILADMIDKEPDVWISIYAPCEKNLVTCANISDGNVEYFPLDTKVIKVKPAEPRVRFIPDV